MAEYINREAVNRISFTDAVLIDGEVRIEKIALVRDIEKLPAADVAPVRHGRWVIDDNNTRECHCSECDWPAPRDAYGYHREQTGYCHVCGAKMDGGAE